MAVQIAGSHTLRVPRERLWPTILDPASLLKLIPGCEAIEEAAPGEYRSRIRLGIAAVGGTYEARVRLAEVEEPRYCRMEGEMSGPAGSLRGEAWFSLEEMGPQTALTYEGKAMVTGALATMSPRFIQGVAQTLIGRGLTRLEEEALAGPADGSPGR